LEEKKEINFENLEFREVEPILKVKPVSKWAGKIILYPRRIYIHRALEEYNLKPKYVKYLIDEKNQWIALKFEEEANDKNLVVHYTQSIKTYVSLPVDIASQTSKILTIKKGGGINAKCIPCHYHNGMLLFSYAKEEASK
jgi:hypothetical protein